MFLSKIKHFVYIFRKLLELFLRNLENADNTELNRTLRLRLEAKEVSMQRLMLLTSLTQNLMNLLVLPCTLNGSLTFCQDFDLGYSRMQILKRQRIVTHTKRYRVSNRGDTEPFSAKPLSAYFTITYLGGHNK